MTRVGEDGFPVPKLCGADVELGAFRRGGTTGRASEDAARDLLREIDGRPAGDRLFAGAPASVSPHGYWLPLRQVPSILSAHDPQDWGRKFLTSNGGCVYIDLGHLELCQPEVLSAFDHVATWHAMLRIARRALDAANAGQPDERRITVLANNSDGHGNSFGSHLNFLVTRRTWNNIFEHKLHQLAYLASYQVSAIVFTGQGKVGSENGAPPVAYQISQRADFMESLTGLQTTYRRPIVNSRDEPLCGSNGTRRDDRAGDAGLARLHVIFFDSTLCHVASLLKVGVTQIVLAMIEAGQVSPTLILDDPLEALHVWSHDPTLRSRARMATGEALTAVELQRRFLDEAQRFAEWEGASVAVPRLAEIIALWHDTLCLLETRDLGALASRVDWVLKLAVLQNVLDARPDLGWDAPAIKHLDHVYSSLEPSEGLYWAFERDERLMKVVSDADIERFEHEPPADTRAWTRTMLLRRADGHLVDDVNWDAVRLRTGSRWSGCRTVRLPNPLAGTSSEMTPRFEAEATLDGLIDSLQCHEDTSERKPS